MCSLHNNKKIIKKDIEKKVVAIGQFEKRFSKVTIMCEFYASTDPHIAFLKSVE
jgi:hypothetical protein